MMQFPQNQNGHRAGKHERHRSPVRNRLDVHWQSFDSFRKDRNYIIKNRSMLPIRRHHRKPG